MRGRHGTHCTAALALVLGLVGVVHAGSLTPTTQEAAALKALTSAIPGARVVWVRGERIYEAGTTTSFTAQLRTQGNIVETNPRFSPDGSQLLTVRSDGVYLMKSDFTQATKVIAGGSDASWTRDGKSITAVDSTGYKVLRYDLATTSSATIYDAQQSPYNGQQVSQAAELRNGGRFLLVFRLTPTHTTEIVDLQLKTYISNTEMQRGDCSPAWATDGSYIITTARTTSRPVLKAAFSLGASGGSVTASTYFVGLDTTEQFYIHGQRAANDGKHVAFGGKIFAGPLKSALREIYVWHIGDPDSAAVRISFDTAEDESPDIYIPPGCTSASQCDDGDPCTTNLCTATKCQYSAISGCCTSSSQCDDSNACTTDSCSSNTCQHASVSGCCASDTDCADSNPCTTDSCDVPSGTCSNSAVSGCCAFDTDCDDADSCTLDRCETTTHGCQHAPMCSDGPVVDGGAVSDGSTRSDADLGLSTDSPNSGGEGASPPTQALVGACALGGAGGPQLWCLLLPLALLLRRRRRCSLVYLHPGWRDRSRCARDGVAPRCLSREGQRCLLLDSHHETRPPWRNREFQTGHRV